MKVLLAVSGGIDSMCMADMYSHTDSGYAVAHCNFHLRGEDSNADAELVRKWADSHGVRFFCADFDTAGYAAANGISIEMAAREQRYAWFAFIAESQGFDAVATAHNANDNAETLILNLLRGTGSRGLRGISQDSPLPGKEGVKLIRPLLGMSRAEIEKYAQKHAVQYREDRTNRESVYKRNRIRNIIFPEFEKLNPSFIRTLNSDIERFRQVDDIAEDYFRECADKVIDGNVIRIKELLGLKHWQYILYRLLEPCGFSAQVLESVTAAAGKIAAGGNEFTFSGKRFESAGYTLETSSDALHIIRKEAGIEKVEERVLVQGPGTYVFNGKTVCIEELNYEHGMKLKQDGGVLICDAAGLPFPFILRRWKAGDWMRPFGMDGRSKKVSDIFTDLKFTLHEKESAVVIEPLSDGDGSHIAAVAGYRMDEALRITKGSTNIIRITVL